MSDVSDRLHKRISTGRHELKERRIDVYRKRARAILLIAIIVILIVPWFFPRYYIITVPIEIAICITVQIRYWIKHGVH